MKKLTKRSKKGFTLVELIVVIAILAILAGVAIPVYSGYITKANEAADYQQLDAIKTAAVFVATEINLPKAIDVTEIEVTADGNGKVTLATGVKVNGTSVTNVESYFGGTAGATVTFKSDTFKTGAKWDGTSWAKK